MKEGIIITIILFVSRFLVAQHIISGSLKSINGDPIPRVNVTVSEIGNDDILGYNISDNQGKYTLKYKSNEKRLQISVKCMGFQFESKIIENKTQTLDFVLIEKVTELKEVIVKIPPITQFGDTLNYNVQAFAGRNDRSIADVLSKMPGIEVLADGKVLYQGKAINKYYIEGLDLLEGKYNLANRNLPFGQVLNVQIFENHQPIRVLDSLVTSDKAALNIQLKNKVSFTGTAKAGIGASPTLYDGNITPMLFSPQQQMISSYQSNNIGNNVASQLKTLTIEDLIDNLDNNEKAKDWLSIQQLKLPNIAEKRWLDNQTHLLTTNYLYKLNKDYELKLNASYLNDTQQQMGATQTVFHLPNQDVLIQEDKNNTLLYKSLQTNLSLQKNTKSSYLKNSLQFKGFWDSQIGNILQNQQPILQDLLNHYFEGSNKLKSIFPIGKQLFTVNSYFGISKTPQVLRLKAKQIEKLFEGDFGSDELRQNLMLKSFSTDNSISLTKAWRAFVFTPKIGIQLEKQFLDSEILSERTEVAPNDYRNQLDWLRIKYYFEGQAQLRKEKFTLDIKLPLNLNSFDIQDKYLGKNQQLNKVFIEPRIAFSYNLNPFWKLNTSVGISNQFGVINNLHYAYIIKSYRNIQRIDSPLPLTNSQNYNVGFSYKNPIKALFSSLNYTFVASKNNLLYSNQILENGVNNLQAIEKDNYRQNHTLTGRFSKSLYDIKTNFAVGASISFQEFPQIINEKDTDIKNISNTYNLQVSTDFSAYCSLAYRVDLLLAKSKVQEKTNQQILNLTQKMNLNIFYENHQLAFEVGYFQNKLSSQSTINYFADLMYRYTLPKQKVDFELHCNNIFNTDNFITTSVDTFTYVVNNYKLRPAQILLKISFPL